MVDMTQGGTYSHIIRFVIPMIIMSVLQVLYNAADMIIVGRFDSETALAAVGSTSSAINLTINLFIGLSSAANVVVARKYGAKNLNGVSKVVHTSIALALISGLFVAVLGIAASRKILLLMGSPEEVIDLSTLYMRIYYLGIPATMLYNFGSAILRAIGDTKRPLKYLTVAGIINIVLNFILVVFFKLSVAGVAIATAVSQIISAILVIRCLIKTDECYKLYLNKIKIHIKELGELLYLGIPAGIQSSIFSMSNVIIQSSINSVGKIAMAGNAAASNIEGVVYVAVNSYYHATVTYISQNYGAGNFKRISKGLRASCVLVTITGIILGGLMCLVSKQVVGIYSEVPEVIAVGAQRLTFICACYFLCGLMDTMVAGIRGMGSSIIPMVISITGICGIRLLMVFMCAPYKEIDDLVALYLSYPVSWAFTTTLHLISFLILKRKKEREFIR
ncbi:MAG: MATE family efflux transporter [Clostridia bacterium]|nr:MATE family efflux transporter [Clostridia bacterium]